MSVRLSVVLAVALAAVMAVAGCGGGGTDESTTASTTASTSKDATTPSISKAEFITRADAICKEGGEQAQSEFAAFAKENKISEGKEPTTAQWEEIGTKILVPALQKQGDQIRQLGIPAGDEAQIETFLDRADEAVEKLEENPETAKSPSTVLAEAREVIKGYGFKVCGTGQ